MLKLLSHKLGLKSLTFNIKTHLLRDNELIQLFCEMKSCIYLHLQQVNPPNAKVKILWIYEVNTMAADALAPCVTRPSAAMV